MPMPMSRQNLTVPPPPIRTPARACSLPPSPRPSRPRCCSSCGMRASVASLVCRLAGVLVLRARSSPHVCGHQVSWARSGSTRQSATCCQSSRSSPPTRRPAASRCARWRCTSAGCRASTRRGRPRPRSWLRSPSSASFPRSSNKPTIPTWESRSSAGRKRAPGFPHSLPCLHW